MISRLLGLNRSDTIGTVLARHRGIGPGFDILRIGLALLIFVGHAKWIAGTQSIGVDLKPFASFGETDGGLVHHWAEFTYPLKMALVPAFFALSGFLVTGSALRLQRTSTFLAHRSLRIFPALVVEVLLSAFILGAFLTTLPLTDYFSSPVFFRYLGNMVGHVSYILPGVFEGARVVHAVNVNLWTLPAELYCYIFCAVAMASGVMYNRKVLTALTIFATVVLAILHALYNYSDGSPYPLHLVVLFFCLGSVAYHWKDQISCDPRLFVPIAALTYVLMMYPALRYLAAPLLTWCTMFIGMIGFKKSKLLASGDYSYGIYLYGFPICQALITVVPWFYGRPGAFILVSAAITAVFAVFSWHCVEKHCLKFKRKLPETWFPNAPQAMRANDAA